MHLLGCISTETSNTDSANKDTNLQTALKKTPENRNYDTDRNIQRKDRRIQLSIQQEIQPNRSTDN